MNRIRRIRPYRSFGTVVAVLAVVLGVTVRGDCGDPLSIYRQMIGSPLETRILAFTRNTLAGVLEDRAGRTTAPEALRRLPPVGFYLTLMRGRRVRACVGSFTPVTSNMETAIRRLTGEVVFADTRSRPVAVSEMPTLSVVLSFTGALREIADPERIDFSSQGLFVAQEGKGVVLLPGETRTLDYGIRDLMEKNRFDSRKPLRYAAFDVVAFDERRQR